MQEEADGGPAEEAKRAAEARNQESAAPSPAIDAELVDLKPKRRGRPLGSKNKQLKKKPGRSSKRQEVPVEEPASTDDGPPAKKQKPVNAQAQIHVGVSEAGASELELVTKCKTDSCSEPTPEQQLELLPKQPDQAGQQLVPMRKRHGRPRKEKPDQAEQ